MLDFTLSSSQKALQSGARQFAQQVLSTAPALYAHLPTQKQRFLATRPIYQTAVKAGLIKGQVPIHLGGTSASLIDAAIVVEEFYAVEPAAALTILGTGLGLSPLIIAGSEEQHARLLKSFLSGEGDPMASLVHSEPGGTANWLEKGGKGLQTTARRDGEDWIINGEKLWTTNSGGWEGEGAELQCVVCRLADRPGETQDPNIEPAELVLILVVTKEDIGNNEPGAYRVLADPELAGHIASSGPLSCFTNFRVPGKNLLAEPGKGAQVVEQTFGASAAIVGAMAVGIMRHAFETALKFAKDDSRGGSVPVIERQSVADLLINIKMRIETSRLLTWKALSAIENGPGDWNARLEMALQAKIFASDAAPEVVIDAMKVVGMKSYDKEMPFADMLQDAVCLPLFDGGNVGIRRRQIERIMKGAEYRPWAATFGEGEAGEKK
jgi:nitroalkane oxidase